MSHVDQSSEIPSRTEPRVSGHIGSFWQEMRTSLAGGGPGGIECIFKADEDGASLAVWNPIRHEWAVANLVGQGDSREPVEERVAEDRLSLSEAQQQEIADLLDTIEVEHTRNIGTSKDIRGRMRQLTNRIREIVGV